MLNHPFKIHVDGLRLHISVVSEGFHRFAVCNSFPRSSKAFHEIIEGPDDLAEHRPQVLARIFGAVNFGAQI